MMNTTRSQTANNQVCSTPRILNAAELNGANLLGANISDVNLVGAVLQAVIMPDGTSYEEISRPIQN